MKTKNRNLDVVHHGLVLVSDGNGRGRPSRLLLSKDQLAVQLPSDGTSSTAEPTETDTPDENATRIVSIKRRGGGLGLSIKGGTENAQNLPIVISKVFPGMPADQCGQLYVGDAIVEVNDISVEGKSHDEVVEMLKAEGDEVKIGVRHYTNITPYLKPATSLQPGRSGSALDKLYEPNTWKSAMKAQSDLGLYDGEKIDGKDEKWKTVTTIPLPMAYVTRYLWGTDNMRPNAFEVRAVDGTSSGIIHCEDVRALDQWLGHIYNHINALNQKSIKMSNKYLHQSEQITFIGWVNEHMGEGLPEDPKLKWEPRFLILKGGDVCFFESPPLSSEDLNKCIYLYKCYDIALRMVPDDSRRLDKRESCCYIETSLLSGLKHYLSFDSTQILEQFEFTYYKCVYNTVTSMQTRTFACSFDGRPCGLVFDIKQGISVYDIPTKSYVWQYRFRDLHSSSDDGKVHVQLVFKDERCLTQDKLETKEIESDEVITIAFNLHSFLITKVVAADPEFIKQNPLL
ncbi:unnamed protein product [Auanema sp. JU1783]|nr:unnamed protein product [Auanema sp. JU1783]